MLTRDQAVTVMMLFLTGPDAVARAIQPAIGSTR
jgi:hypothetical protein